MVLEIRGRWLHRCCFVRCCFQDLFITVPSIIVQLPPSVFSVRFVSVHVVHPYSAMDTTAAWKNAFYFIGQVWSPYDQKPIDAFAWFFSVDERLLTMYVNLFTSFRDSPFLFWLKHMHSILFSLTWRLMSPAASFRLCSKDSAWVIVCAEYRLLVAFARVKPFSFIKSIDVRST